MPAAELALLRGLCRIEVVPAGTLLCGESTPAHTVYFLQAGAVELRVRGEPASAPLAPGQVRMRPGAGGGGQEDLLCTSTSTESRPHGGGLWSVL